MLEFDRVVCIHDVLDELFAPGRGLGMSGAAEVRGRDHHDALVLISGATLGELELLQPLDRSSRSRGIDAQRVCEVPHAPRRLLDEQIECVHLADFQGIVANAEEVFDEPAHRGTAPDFAPRASDPQRDFALGRVVNVDSGSIGGDHWEPGYKCGTSVPAMESPLEALGVIATQSAMVTPDLRHIEMFTMRGLVTLMWHEVNELDSDRSTLGPAAIVACGGAMGGLLGPAGGLYQELGDRWSRRGVPVVRVSYRRPNDLDACCLDVAAAVQMTVDAGARKVVVVGHSFGGAVAVRVGVAMGEVAGVVTLATQSAGCEIAPGLRGRPLLLFHGDADEILPMQSSEIVAAMAGRGEVVVCPGDGHLLSFSGVGILDRLDEWIPATLGSD